MYAAGGGGGGGGRGWDTADADARAFRVCEINIDGPTDTSLSFDLTVLYFFYFPCSLLPETREAATARVWDEHSRRSRKRCRLVTAPACPLSLTQVDCPGNGRQNEDLILGRCGGDVFAAVSALNLI